MDYSQFLIMKQEIGLLAVFLIVFLADTFLPRREQGSIGVISCIFFAAFTVLGFVPGVAGEGVAFSGMYEATWPVINIKNILNVGVLIVMIQALRWVADQDMVRIRRGEFYELLLVTLLGMYFMISAPSLPDVRDRSGNSFAASGRNGGFRQAPLRIA